MTYAPLKMPMIVSLILAVMSCTKAFVPSLPVSTKIGFTSLFMAKKGKGSGNAKGFGKIIETPSKSQSMEDVATAIDKSSPVASDPSVGGMLKSVEGGSNELPKIDESMPVEERTKAILRDQYGLRTREEQQDAQRREENIKEQRKKLSEWKKMADKGQDFDIMQILPEPVLVGIDRFLKVGVAICTLLFVVAGIFITIEAYSKTTGNALPEDLDKFIVNIVEPNFTPGLGVLLGFSISLGAFAAAQLSSASSNYKEGR